jgi:S-adenosylmethionine synthetase
MMIIFEKYTAQPFEVVERKGTGHPDSLADGISEAISRGLCRHYLEESGRILHHNVDKVLLIGGRTAPEFLGGSVIQPITVVVGGRATATASQPISDIITLESSEYLQSAICGPLSFVVEPRAKEGSPELQSLMGVGANDTSIGVGFAPLNDLESLVLDLEPVIKSVPSAGQDVKIMAVRNGSDLSIVISAAMRCGQLSSLEDYKAAVGEIAEKANNATFERLGTDAQVRVNAGDREKNIFLTISGTSAEMGDDGATGRGNRGSGLITPMRPMTMEAIAGKNPVIHVGKIYNILAKRAAEDIATMVGVNEAYVTLVSKIGSPISEPLASAATVYLEDKAIGPKDSAIQDAIDYHLETVEDVAAEFVAGRIPVF